MSSLYLVKASDPVLRSRAAQALIDELLDGEDRTLVVEEFAVPTKVRGGGDEPGAPLRPGRPTKPPVPSSPRSSTPRRARRS